MTHGQFTDDKEIQLSLWMHNLSLTCILHFCLNSVVLHVLALYPVNIYFYIYAQSQ